MEQAKVEDPRGTGGSVIDGPTVEVCVGRCCRAHAPNLAEHKRRLRYLQQMVEELGGEVLRPACLGQCLRERVLVARRQVDGGIESRWLASLTVGPGLEGLAAWMAGAEPPPAVAQVLAAATFDENDARAGCHCGDPFPST